MAKKLNIIVLGIRGFPCVMGGVEKHCEELYPRLVKLGCDITVITRTSYIPRKKRVDSWKKVRFIHLWAIRQKHLETILHTFLGVIIASLKTPDILHIHAIGPSIWVLLAKLLGLKVIVTHHGPDYQRQKWGKIAVVLLRLGEFVSIKFADKVIVISKQIKKMLTNKYNRKDLEFIPNGVNLPERILTADILKKYDLKSRKYIFTACRFVPEKGLHDLIAAYKKLENPEFKLVIAGDADHESQYSREIKKTAKEIEGIILTGFFTGKHLQELYSNAGLFVLPSYYEGLPIALLEALSYNLSVLVSDIPQNREITLPDYRYFEPGDINELVVKIGKLLKSDIGAEEKGFYKKLLEKQYNWDKIAQQTLKVYNKII